MSLWLHPYFIALSLSALVAVITALIGWKRRLASTASKPFVGLMLAIAGYSIVAALEVIAIALPDKIFWSKLEYVGSGSVITCFLILALHFTHKQHWLKFPNWLFLWFVPALNMALAATNEWHHLVWSGFLRDPNGSHLIIYRHGIGFYWVLLCSYVYTLMGTLLLIQAAVQPGLLQRRQSKLILLGAIIPVIGSAVYVLGLTPPGLNTTPMSFLGCGLLYFVNLFHSRMLDLVPIARDLLIENMQDGVIVLDKLHRVVDINPAAQGLVGLRQKVLGTPIEQIFPTWHDIWLHRIQTGSRSALALQGEQMRYVELQTTELRDRDQRIIGFLLIVQDVTHRYQTERQLRQANQCLKQQLMEIELLQAQLRDQANRDGLTGVYNRRYLEEQIHHELAQAAQTGESVAILMLDIDYFKKINDTYGHQAGDRVLQAFGKLLRQHSRASDLVCRYGGEEFVVVMPGLNLELATQRAEAIRKAFQTLQVVWHGKLISSTLSIGLGTFPQHGSTFEELLRVVDSALYEAKSQGRNVAISVAMLPNLRLLNESV